MAGLWLVLLAFRLAAVPAAEPPCKGGGDACPAPAIATSGGPSMLAISKTSLQQQALQEGVLSGDVAEPAGAATSGLIEMAATANLTRSNTGASYFQDLDVSYGSNSKQMVDVYWPKDATLKPSGGWSAVIITPGDGSTKQGLKGFCTKYMVPSGRLCVAADYRQSDKDRNDDMFDLAKWFSSKASTWDVDQTNIVLGGQSLGALTINNVIWNKDMGKKLLSGSPAMIRAVLLLSGTWDGHQRQAKQAKYWPASTYICSSTTDKTVPYKYSKNLWKELDKLGEPVKFVTFEDAGHAIWYSDQKEDWYAEIVSFLDETVP